MNQNIRIMQTGFNARYNTWHTINRNMIMYVHSGTGSIIDRAKNYPIVPGCMCFVGANRFYYTLPDDPESYVRSKIFMSNQELSGILKLFPKELHMDQRFNPNSISYAQMPPKKGEEIEALFRRLQFYDEQPCYHDAMRTAEYLRLLVELDSGSTDIVFPASGLIQKTVEYINSHIHEDIRIEDICEHVHISKYYLCKRFRLSTGLTVMNYILKTRIISAKNMLEDASLSIGEISDRCGFSSQSYFCRVFKEEAGLTPLQYQKSLQEPEDAKNRQKAK